MAEIVTVGGLETRKASSVREGVLQVSRVSKVELNLEKLRVNFSGFVKGGSEGGRV